jgi:hypothetical protein
MENRSYSDAGGTPGGLGQFLMGFVMTCIGGYFLSNQVMVTGSYWNLWGFNNSFGITLVPLLFGVGILANQREFPGVFLHNPIRVHSR